MIQNLENSQNKEDDNLKKSSFLEKSEPSQQDFLKMTIKMKKD